MIGIQNKNSLLATNYVQKVALICFPKDWIHNYDSYPTNDQKSLTIE